MMKLNMLSMVVSRDKLQNKKKILATKKDNKQQHSYNSNNLSLFALTSCISSSSSNKFSNENSPLSNKSLIGLQVFQGI